MLLIGFAGSFWTCSQNEPLSGMIIFTQLPVDGVKADFSSDDQWRYLPNMKIAAIHPQKASNAKILTDDFYSARSPEISFDGKKLLFSGQKNEGDIWQIWEMNLKDQKFTQITSRSNNCTDPAYLPAGRIVFSGAVNDDIGIEGHSLFTISENGTEEVRITFQPHADLASSVLQDGRILISSTQLFPSVGIPKLLVLRPDGTKAELFYKNQQESHLSNRGRETPDGKVVFVETNESKPERGELVSVKYSRPLHTKENLSIGMEGSFHSVSSVQNGNAFASFLQKGSESYNLFAFNSAENQIGNSILDASAFHAIEPVNVTKRNVPRKLPTIVNELKKEGWFLCMDAHKSELEANTNDGTFSVATKVQVEGLKGKWGELPLEEDGSFYIKVSPNEPLRFSTLNENNEVVRGPSAWMWVRPGERRGCVGCHENHELAPENIVPAAINQAPHTLSPYTVQQTEVETFLLRKMEE